MIYFVVRAAELKKGPDQTLFCCDLESRRQKVSFCLIVEGSSSWHKYKAQYAAVAQHLTVGTLLSCEMTYAMVHECFQMGLTSFQPIEIIDAKTDKPVDADTYFSLDPNTIVITQPLGPLVLVPGTIDLGGEAYVPLFGQERIVHMRQQFGHKRGLRWGRRPSFFRLMWGRFRRRRK